MAKTGQKFDINPETFTLQNVFAMELHRFQETIAEIVTCATKELGIEKVFMRFYVQIKEHICDVTCQNQTNVAIFHLPEIKF